MLCYQLPNPRSRPSEFHVTILTLCYVGVLAQIKRIIHLEVQSKPMYLRTLLYALRQGVALDTRGSASTSPAPSSISAPGVGEGVDNLSSDLTHQDTAAGRVPDRLLDLYLSTEDSISLTSKVLDVYAAYVDEGEVRLRLATRASLNYCTKTFSLLHSPSTAPPHRTPSGITTLQYTATEYSTAEPP